MNSLARVSSLAALLLTVTTALVGCAADTDGSDEKTDDGSAESLESALVGSIKDLGEIPGTGEARTTRYNAPPRYAAYTFYANGGEEVDVDVKSLDGRDAMAWILDSRGRHLGFNDDAAGGGTFDSHIHTKLPASLGTKVKLRVAFREYRMRSTTLSVAVKVHPTGCEENGVIHPIGEAFRSVDGCNTCTCMPSGLIACTKRFCPPPRPGCNYDGVQYDVGASFRATDGCNVCSCGDNGVVACTKMACPVTCTYDGVRRSVGETFPSTDGCNTCSCTAGGSVACTERACACVPAANDPNAKYVGSSPAQCQVIRYACEPGTTGFSNACGCGCQQPADCPAFINCMPGPGVPSCAPARARCPYTPVAY